jgi:thiol-disulfide isomerase/thioredoxin
MLLHLAAYASKITLALTFGYAGIAKLLNIKSSQMGIEEFGISRRAARPLGVLLPLVEVAAAIALFSGIALVGEAIILCLLLVFIGAISVNIALGRKPICRCFGATHSEPVGWLTLIRNFGLAVLAVVSLLTSGERLTVDFLSRFHTWDELQRSSIAMGCAILGIILWLMLDLFHTNRRLLQRLRAIASDRKGIPQEDSAQLYLQEPSSVAYSFELPNVVGGTSNLDEFISFGKPVLLLFIDSNCGGCNELLPEVAIWQKTMVSEITIVVVSRGEVEVNHKKATAHGIDNVLTAPEERVQTIAQRYGLDGTPSLVFIRSDGILASRVITGQDKIRRFVFDAGWKNLKLPAPAD